jgi:hypothetical protein
MDAIEPRKEKIEYSEKFVAFIDILGFKKLILNSDHRKSLENIRIISESFEVFRRNLNANGIIDFTAKYFSDNICISSSIDKVGIAINYLIHALAEFQLFLALKNIFIRGGLSIGSHYQNENIIFSKGLIHAYLMEKEKAIFPRILIDNRLLKTLSRSLLEPTHKLQFIYYEETDELGFIDYLAAAGLPGGPIVELDEKFNLHKNAIQYQLEHCKDDLHTLDKYVWLSQYHNFKLCEQWNERDFKIPREDLKIELSNFNLKFHAKTKSF